MYTLDAKININHCHLAIATTVYSLYIIFLSHKNCLLLDTYNTEFLEITRYCYLITDDLLSGYTHQLDVQSHPMQSVLFLDNAAPQSCCAEPPLHIPTYPRLTSTAATVREKTCGETKSQTNRLTKSQTNRLTNRPTTITLSCACVREG